MSGSGTGSPASPVTPAAEPLTAAEVLAYCRIDFSNQEPAPGVITAALLSPAAAGSVDNGAHRYLATFITADGETQAGQASAAVTVADKTANGKVSLSGIPTGGALVTARKLYRTAAGGAVFYLLATLADNSTTSYTDNVADASLGAEAPTVNTTADPLIGLLIASARGAAEQELRRKLITQTVDHYLDCFPRHVNARFGDADIRLPPLVAVTSITYVDGAGDTQILAADQYIVDTASKPSRIQPAYGCTWPAAREQANAIRIRTVQGYGDPADVPQCVRNWMLMRIKTLWENRDQIVIGATGMVEIPANFADSLLDPERVYGRTT